jgi:uncharacterized membrane protein YgcG
MAAPRRQRRRMTSRTVLLGGLCAAIVVGLGVARGPDSTTDAAHPEALSRPEMFGSVSAAPTSGALDPASDPLPSDPLPDGSLPGAGASGPGAARVPARAAIVHATSSPPAAEGANAAAAASVYFADCAAARAAGAAPILRGAPGYRSPLDRDDDGVACETDERSGGTSPGSTSGSGGGSGGSSAGGSSAGGIGAEGSAIAPPTTRTVTPTTLAHPTSSTPSASQPS